MRKRWLVLGICRKRISKLCLVAMGTSHPCVRAHTRTHTLQMKRPPSPSHGLLSPEQTPGDLTPRPCKLILLDRLLGLDRSAQIHCDPLDHPPKHRSYHCSPQDKLSFIGKKISAHFYIQLLST